MAEIKEFVVNDRRKFTAEGDARPDAPPSEPKAPRPETLESFAPPADEFNSSARLTEPKSTGPQSGPQIVPDPDPVAVADSQSSDPDQPPALTAEQLAQAAAAYTATVDRLDTAIRSANPGMEPIPQMTYERVIQSLYMQTMLQLGASAEPNQKPQVDILGARQTIDMLNVLASKTSGNLSASEQTLIDAAIFELHMGFLEVTQALARQAQQAAAQPRPGGPGFPPPPGSGPSIVR